MRRKEPPSQAPARGRSLISARANQSLQRKTTGGSTRSLLPRSYSSPSSQNENPERKSPQAYHKDFMMRSFSSPEHKNEDYRRNSDSFFRPKAHGSRSELDSDLDNFDQFEEYLIDIDADQDENLGVYNSSPERDEPKKVITTMLPGSGLHRVSLKPLASATSQTLHSAREAMKKLQKADARGNSRLNYKPLVVKMPALHMLQSDVDTSQLMEELQTSPELEIESAELDRELDDAEQHLDQGVAIATEESDADTVSVDL